MAACKPEGQSLQIGWDEDGACLPWTTPGFLLALDAPYPRPPKRLYVRRLTPRRVGQKVLPWSGARQSHALRASAAAKRFAAACRRSGASR